MRNLYIFFEVIYHKLNSIALKGQSEDNNAHFALVILTLLLNFNFITFFIVLDKIKVMHLWISNQYEVIAFVVATYFINYILFVRKEKYKMLKEKYSFPNKVQSRKMNYYFGIYVILTLLSFLIIVLI